MMRALQIGSLLLLLSAASLCGFGSWLAWNAYKSDVAITADVHASLQSEKMLTDNANGVIATAKPKIAASLDNLQRATKNAADATANLRKASAGVDVAIAEINKPCHAGECGTLADVNRTLGSIRLAAGQVTAISEKEQSQRVLMNAQETQLANDTHDDLVKLGEAVDGITALSTNKDLTSTFTQLNGTMKSLDGMAAETAEAWHKFLHPAWPKRVQNAVTTWGSAVAKFFVP